MSKFYRNFMMVGAITIGLAACGDDLTITETPPPVIEIPPPPPPPPPVDVPNITSFSVSPSSVALAKGTFVQAAATLLTEPGLSGSIAWATSNAGVATVSSNGLITAVSEGAAVITATATVDGETAQAGVGVTVTAEEAKIVSFSVTPANAAMVEGEILQSQANLTTVQGVSGTIAWVSSNAAVATVDANGKITAVAPGAATITATASAGGQTATQTVGITVRAIIAAQVSINSVTASATGLPVVLNAVAGQIDVNMNFDPGEQTVEKIEVFIGGVSAATQTFATSPAAGVISLSINTAAYTVSPTAAATSWKNGPTTVSAAITPQGASSPTATNDINIVLVNADGWMATLDAAPATSAAGPGGLTYWGGPGAAGVAAYTLRPVIYTPGRSITAVTWNVAGCGVGGGAAGAYPASFGYTSGGATVGCGAEYVGAPARHNVAVTAATDNSANPYPVGGMIPNLTIFGSTPDSMRYDWTYSGAVGTPSVTGAKGFNWVNASWGWPVGSGTESDAGVGVSGATWAAFLSGPGTPITSASTLAETNTNTSTDGYRLFATASDKVGNAKSSATSAYFGYDNTAPSIRYASVGNLPSIYTQGGSTAQADSTTRLAIQAMFAAGTTDSVQTEAIDNRSGLSNSVTSMTRFAQNGGTGGTTGLGSCVATSAFGAAFVDGWRPAAQAHIACGSAVPGYYNWRQYAVDRAGNSSSMYKRTFAFDPGQPAITGVSPNASYTGNAAAPFTIGAQDDLEVIDGTVRMHYPGLTQGDAAATASDGIRWPFGSTAGAVFATRFDNSIINPVLPTATIDRYTTSIQEVCQGTIAIPGASCPAYAGDPVIQADIAVAKPDSVAASVRDVFGSFSANLVAGATTGVSAEFASPLLSATLPTPGFFSVTYDGSVNCTPGGVAGGPCVTSGINWRWFSTSGTTRTFQATQDQSITTPMFTIVELWGVNGAGEHEFISRCTVTAAGTSFTCAGSGSIVGLDNGFERLWRFTLTGATGYASYRAMGLTSAGIALFSEAI